MEQSILDRVNSYEDACKIKGIEPLTIEAFAALPENQRQRMLSRHRVETVIEVVNEGKEFDWNNEDQYKYYPWWDMETYGDSVPGSGFAVYAVYCTGTDANVGAALCCHSREASRHVAEIMIEDYRIICKTI